MNANTLLLRQVHPSFCLDEVLSSQAFVPFPKDKNLLSVYDGDQVSPSDSFVHYTQKLGFGSVGVWAVSVAETGRTGLSARPDPLENSPAHAVIDFGEATRNECRKLAKKLAMLAQERGRLHP